MALGDGFASHMQAVSRRTKIDILRLHIKGVGIDVCAHGGQIVDLSGQRTTDIHLAAQMANVFAGGVAIMKSNGRDLSYIFNFQKFILLISQYCSLSGTNNPKSLFACAFQSDGTDVSWCLSQSVCRYIFLSKLI